MILGPHTVTRLRGEATIDRSSGENTKIDWATPAELDQPGCSVQPGSPNPRLLQQRSGTVIDYTVWAALDFDVTENDRIRWNGATYHIADTIQRWDFPGLGHLVIPIKRVEG